MLFEDREQTRNIFFEVWQKFTEHQPLEPLEQQLLEIIKRHPEYHATLAHPEKYRDKDYFPEVGEVNPFLHLSLHQAVLDQVRTDLPKGIRRLYQELIACFEDAHEAEHCMMNSLAIGIFDASKNNKPFNDKAYLKRIKKALRDGHWT
jgi:hypothetical protein